MKTIITTTIALGLTSVLPASSETTPVPLSVDVYNSGPAGVFPVTSVIISGPREVVLVDAQFARRDAVALVERIKAMHRTLTTIYISHSDPDYYFGLETLRQAFPAARIVATPQTVAAIKASMHGKLAYWAPVLKDEAPTRVILPDPLAGDTLYVDDQPLRIVGLDGPAPERTFVWAAANRTVLGGVPVMANMHVWLADTQTPSSRMSWLKLLGDIVALEPAVVVPGHFLPNPDGSLPLDLGAVEFTRNYLVEFEHEAAKADDAAALVAAMKARYPALGGIDSLELSAKVLKGELNWPEGTPGGRYLAIGKRVQVSFGEMVFVLDFQDDKVMSFLGVSGPFKGATDTVQYTAVAIGPKLFMVYWHEPKGGANVVHVQDFEKGLVHTNIAQPGGEFFNLSGTLQILGARR